jgi:hypothetical protein
MRKRTHTHTRTRTRTRTRGRGRGRTLRGGQDCLGRCYLGNTFWG